MKDCYNKQFYSVQKVKRDIIVIMRTFFEHLVYYSPWRNKVIKSSLKIQACMKDCYNKQFYSV